jgi:hypothetical protein
VKLLCRAGVKLFFNIKFDDCLIFQKLSMEEQLVIMSYDYIENETILLVGFRLFKDIDLRKR